MATPKFSSKGAGRGMPPPPLQFQKGMGKGDSHSSSSGIMPKAKPKPPSSRPPISAMQKAGVSALRQATAALTGRASTFIENGTSETKGGKGQDQSVQWNAEGGGGNKGKGKGKGKPKGGSKSWGDDGDSWNSRKEEGKWSEKSWDSQSWGEGWKRGGSWKDDAASKDEDGHHGKWEWKPWSAGTKEDNANDRSSGKGRKGKGGVKAEKAEKSGKGTGKGTKKRLLKTTDRKSVCRERV
eukprot:TRINITY_DN38763_c0_g1_i1.p1 TRINITY_DN38763_c0_g1~~TRINITY_DN38763_c0_g1_i1.p1  ORF type:complete len:239 (-),score=48.39 TRINITY_DN38763_c0_g1_i1:69-785(-)